MRLIRLLVVLVVGVVVAAITPAAHADWMRSTDARGDVQRTHLHVVTDPPIPVVTVPHHANGDITAIRVNHTDSSVRVTVRLRELARIGEAHFYWFRFRTGARIREVFFYAHEGEGGLIDRATPWPGSEPEMSTPNGTAIRCAMSRTIDYPGNTVRLVVPRRCLGNPHWIRVGARVATRPNYDPYYYDDAFGSGGSYRRPTPLGPRVYR